jgi:hypothetical protein
MIDLILHNLLFTLARLANHEGAVWHGTRGDAHESVGPIDASHAVAIFEEREQEGARTAAHLEHAGARTHIESLGNVVGRLYAISTLGSFVGTVSAGFLLLPNFNNVATLLVCAALLAIIPAVYFAFYRKKLLPGAGAAATDPVVAEQVEVAIKYAGYIDREWRHIEKSEQICRQRIPDGFDYHAIGALRYESREKLSAIRPRNLGQAARISGITPAAISLVLVHLKRGLGLPPPVDDRRSA